MPQVVPQFNKTRIAPTPSGFLHLGNILSFTITATLARKHNSKILLRIDDLDQTRSSDVYLQDIFDTLKYMNIPWDEGPQDVVEFKTSYSQVNRLGLYNKALEKLADDRCLFACTCSRSQLGNNLCTCIDKKISLNTENVSWRLKTPETAIIKINNYNGSITQTALPDEMENFIVRKKDGFPAYQLTSVIDDLFYGVDLIIRGEDLWPSTIAQHQLALSMEANGFAGIAFYHHTLLMEAEGKKLSKSAGSTSIKYLRESGKTPGDVYQLIAEMAGVEIGTGTWEALGESLLKM